MADAIKPLYTAHGTAQRRPQRPYPAPTMEWSASICRCRRRWAGPASRTPATPEHLFAAGYAACFGGALDFIAKRHKKDASKATVKCAVSIGPREKGGFGLAVVLDVTDASLPRPSFSRWPKRRTRRSAPIATPHAAMSTSRSSPTGRNRPPLGGATGSAQRCREGGWREERGRPNPFPLAPLNRRASRSEVLEHALPRICYSWEPGARWSSDSASRFTRRRFSRGLGLGCVCDDRHGPFSCGDRRSRLVSGLRHRRAAARSQE